MVDAGKHNKEWRKIVSIYGRKAWGGRPLLNEPLYVSFEFVVQRPGVHYKTNGTLKPTAPLWPWKRPDTTKYIRSTEDALTGLVWVDDGAIVRQFATKDYGRNEGCTITIRKMEPDLFVED